MSYFSASIYNETATYLRDRLPQNLKSVSIGIVCGSGLGGLESCLEGNRVEFAYSDIPHFVQSTVPGHAGKLIFGMLAGKASVLMVGRHHYYEGYDVVKTVLPIRVMKCLGVQILLTTNAAGGLHPDFKVGDFMVLSDHISVAGIAGVNPLIGPNIPEFGPRFPPVSDAYDFDLRVLLIKAALLVNIPQDAIKEGVYSFVTGPSYETRAESRYLKSIGADCVGMSTIPEVVAAKHCGLKVVGLSLITNKVACSKGRSALAKAFNDNGITNDIVSEEVSDELSLAKHDEVLAASRVRSIELQAVVRKFVECL